jgi:hypothetical protein
MHLKSKGWKITLLVGVSGLGLVACSSSSPSKPTPTPNAKVGVVQKLLPPGFTATGAAGLVAGPLNLIVAPDPGFVPGQVAKIALPSRSQLALIAGTVINLTVGTDFRSLYLSQNKLVPGTKITVAAAGLSVTPGHDVLFVLQGPSYRAEHLVAGADGVAVGIVSLPNSMNAGNWVMAVVDYSQVKAVGSKLSGQILADVAEFTIG